LHFLKEWILSHIGVCDRDLANYIITLKKEGRLGEMLAKKAV